MPPHLQLTPWPGAGAGQRQQPGDGRCALTGPCGVATRGLVQVNLQPNAHSKGCIPACIEQSGALSLALQSQHEAIGPDMGLNRVI